MGLIARHTLDAAERKAREQGHAARAWAPLSEAFRPTINEEAWLEGVGDEMYTARMEVAAGKAKQPAELLGWREEGEIVG